MAKINIIKSKLTGCRNGEFSLTNSNLINLKLNFQKRPEFRKELLELLSKYFDIVTLSQNLGHRGRGSVGKSFGEQRRKDGKTKK